MNDVTRRWVRLTVLTFAAALGGFCLALQTAAASGGDISTVVWISAAAAGGVAASTTITAGLSEPPKQG